MQKYDILFFRIILVILETHTVNPRDNEQHIIVTYFIKGVCFNEKNKITKLYFYGDYGVRHGLCNGML